MPSAVADDSLKRKRSKSSAKSNKRAKAESDSEEDSTQQTQILGLESEILESKKHYNNITKLLEIARDTEDSENSVFATVSLCRVFLRLLAGGHLLRSPGQSDKEIVVVQWLKSRLGDYKSHVVAALGRDETASTTLTLAMRILKAESQHSNDKSEYNFPKVFFTDIVRALLQHGSEEVREEFCEKFLGEFADIRFYTFKAMKEILAAVEEDGDSDLFDAAFDMLAFFEDVPDNAEEMGDFYIEAPTKKGHPVTSLHQQKRQAQEAWLAVLALGMSREQRKKVLGIMTGSIAPWFSKPELLMDFLTDSYNAGGATSLLALSGVFYLIKERNLDYPSFYRKLYSLLDADILHSKHRSRFLRLLDTFLGSSHLPVVMVASFIKRISRLCLSAPPAAIVSVIPWIYNLFKKHPGCTFMMHRVLRTAEEKEAIQNSGYVDPFLENEQDPMETQAIESSLWEIVQLQSHYHPNVATIAKIISEQFTKQSYNVEDFLDHSYSSLLDAELAKQIRKAPVVEFMIPKRVFLPQDPGAEAEDTLLAKLWDFQ
ncbi:CBF/Mak21 family-domain-containing protein [Microdochium bolleyi]|uniref:CBF/Mak21 family-domain-containing protein n=1 Tax=Microdochium bolleyi TaxID=196109 RepID=A0A136J5E2_9PEZI|nr:CBF/Mak21 family-domain-containing protein [Microdochium bolleyi]